MMNELRDPGLEALFSEAKLELEGDAMTARVMAGTRNRLVRMAAAGVTAALIALLVGWYVFAGPLLEFAVLISQFLTNPLFDLGEGWLALAFLPVNNAASLTVLAAKGFHLLWKKITGATFLR